MRPEEKPFMTIKQEKFFQHNLFKQEWINHVVNRRTELRIKTSLDIATGFSYQIKY